MPVVSRYAKLRWRRRIRTRKKRVVEISGQANESVDRYLLRRWQSLADVRRFVSVWLTLLVLAASTLVVQTRALGGYYLTDGPIGGGVYVEGLVGRFSNANPIYAVSQADASVSKLLFSSLLSYNDANQLVGDLAESYQSNDRANGQRKRRNNHRGSNGCREIYKGSPVSVECD